MCISGCQLAASLCPCVCDSMNTTFLSWARIQENCLVATAENLRASQKCSWFSQERGGKMKRISHEIAGCSRLHTGLSELPWKLLTPAQVPWAPNTWLCAQGGSPALRASVSRLCFFIARATACRPNESMPEVTLIKYAGKFGDNVYLNRMPEPLQWGILSQWCMLQ